MLGNRHGTNARLLRSASGAKLSWWDSMHVPYRTWISCRTVSILTFDSLPLPLQIGNAIRNGGGSMIFHLKDACSLVPERKPHHRSSFIQTVASTVGAEPSQHGDLCFALQSRFHGIDHSLWQVLAGNSKQLLTACPGPTGANATFLQFKNENVFLSICSSQSFQVPSAWKNCWSGCL